VPTEPVQPRIGHAEREHAVELLRETASLGRIDLDELDERLERALAARTQPELDAVLDDLRPAPPVAGGGLLGRAPGIPALGHAPDDPLVLSAGGGTARRTGAWEVPGWIRLSPAMGSMRVDCRRATTRYPVIDVEVAPSAGSVVLILPEGWAADVDRISRGIGSVKSTVPVTPAPGAPVLLHGSAGMGSVKVRRENWWDRRSGDR
jgi:hypothetical protein